ncbi:MAG: tetratricopeptide repeat protein [Candidatus Zixiibacteriota bacterium]|nr:MAG: tetratricopeptide repeat protein [candidate division Zixibacteria bacterium]
MLIRAMIWLLLAVLVAGCSQSLYMQGRKYLDKGEYDPAIEAFYKEIAANPTSAEAWRELGVTYYEKGDLTKAEDALKQANQIQPDARIHLYLGLIYEKQEDLRKAINAYTTSLSLQPKGKMASMTRAHLDRLISKKLEADASAAVENESIIDTDTIPENTIAVANFDGSYLSPELAPIAHGLAEFTSIDLAKVHSLTVVERLKLDMILKELELSASEYVDPASAPRMGRLMGTRRLVTGSVVSIGEEGLKLDAAIVNTVDSSAVRPQGVEGKLEKFFEAQKEFVFGILDELGITLSAEERDAIKEVPTESYLAFLAYSRGLDYRSRGPEWFGASEQEFALAVQYDRNFQQANQQLRAVTDMQTAGVEYQDSFDRFEGSVRQQSDRQRPSNGLDSRLSSVAQNSGTIPRSSGDSSVDPVDEPSNTGTVTITGDLDAQ